MTDEPFIFEPFDLPVFDVPQKEHWPMAISWDDAIRMLESQRALAPMAIPSAEERLRAKNPAPFRLD